MEKKRTVGGRAAPPTDPLQHRSGNTAEAAHEAIKQLTGSKTPLQQLSLKRDGRTLMVV